MEKYKRILLLGFRCAGKTTISKALAEKYGFLRYDVDEKFDEHLKLSNIVDQPNMNKTFKNADEFFLRNQDEYVAWLKNNSKEQLKFILDDLIELSKTQKVVCDMHLLVEEAKVVAEKNQIVFLTRENNNHIIDEYCNRASHIGFKNFINSSSNPTLAKQNCNAVLKRINDERYNEIINSEFFYIVRNSDSTVENTLKQVEEHFKL